MEDDKIVIKPIGEYIDQKIKLDINVKRLDDNKENEMGDTFYVDTSNDNIMSMSVDKNGKISWNKVSALTKHLPINKDGTDDLVKIKTRLGREVSATKAKSFLTRIDNEIVPIRGDEIKVGTIVPVMKNCPVYSSKNCVIDLSSYFDMTCNDAEIINRSKGSDVFYDEIISIETVKPSHKYVYDLTVESDKTFILYNGLAVYDTFHFSGIKSSVSLGVPRVKELLSLSRNIKTAATFIYLDKEYRNNQDIVNQIASHLKHTTISDVRKTVSIYYDPDPLRKGGFMEKDNVYNVFYSHKTSKYTCQEDFVSLPWLLRIELDREKLMEKDIRLLDIKSKFCNQWQERYKDVKGMKKEEKVIMDRITQISILSNSDNDSNPTIHIRFDMTEFDYSILVSFIDTFIENFKLKGVDGITKIANIIEEGLINFNKETGEKELTKQWVIYTSGVNMNQMRYINGIDLNKTFCNDIMLIYDIYGIDAVRLALIKEFKQVFAEGGSNISYSHIELLCDLITNTGVPASIDRHGMNKTETDPLARASFEKSVEQLINAAIFGETDHMKNVSSRIMAGLVIKGGTGLCNVILDSDFLEKSEYIEETVDKLKKEDVVTTSSVITDVVNKESSNIFVPMD